MASSIEVKVGPLTVRRTWANDAKVAEVWRRYANAAGVDPTLPNAERLEEALTRLVQQVVAQARMDRSETEVGLE